MWEDGKEEEENLEVDMLVDDIIDNKFAIPDLTIGIGNRLEYKGRIVGSIHSFDKTKLHMWRRVRGIVTDKEVAQLIRDKCLVRISYKIGRE